MLTALLYGSETWTLYHRHDKKLDGFFSALRASVSPHQMAGQSAEYHSPRAKCYYWHSNLLHKMAQLDIPDEVCNWLVSFFHAHTHSTQYVGVASSVLGIIASIIQRSAILRRHSSLSVLQTSKQSILGIYSSSLKTIRISLFQQLTTAVGRLSSKTSLSGPETTISRQIRLNFAEIVVVDNRKTKKAHPPPSLPGIVRVTTLQILVVTFTNSLS